MQRHENHTQQYGEVASAYKRELLIEGAISQKTQYKVQVRSHQHHVATCPGGKVDALLVEAALEAWVEREQLGRVFLVAAQDDDDLVLELLGRDVVQQGFHHLGPVPVAL